MEETVTSSTPTMNENGCQSSVVIRFEKENSWSDGYGAKVWISNLLEEAIDGWELAWTFQGDVVLEKVWRGVGEVGQPQVELMNTATTQAIGVLEENYVKFTTETPTSAEAPILVTDVAWNGVLCQPGNEPLTFVCQCEGHAGYQPPAGSDVLVPVGDSMMPSDSVCKSPLEQLLVNLQGTRTNQGDAILVSGVISHSSNSDFDLENVHVGVQHSGIALVGSSSTVEEFPIDQFQLTCENLFVEKGGPLLTGNICNLAQSVTSGQGLGVTLGKIVLCEDCLLTGGSGAMFSYKHVSGYELDATFSVNEPTCAWNESCICNCGDNGLLWQDQGYTTSAKDGGWLSEFGCIRHDSFGIQDPEDNISIELNPEAKAGEDDRVIRTFYPKGSWSPNATRHAGIPVGGAQFKGDLATPAQEALRLSYWGRLDPEFDCVLGGKLPGLYGGVGNTGANLPTGVDGFSTRLMWRDARCTPDDPLPGSCDSCNGEIYAFLPFIETGIGNPCNANISDSSGTMYECNCRQQTVFDHVADLCKNFSIRYAYPT